MNDDQQSGNSGAGGLGSTGGAGSAGGTGGGQLNEPGYHTPGQDYVIRSTSEAVPTPSQTREQELTDPKPVIQSINETPGDANPALAETIASEQGQLSTAELLLARESAEEAPVRGRGLPAYEDQSTPGTPRSDELQEKDSGRPTWPDDRRVDPVEYMESPRANAPLMTGVEGRSEVSEETNLAGRMDQVVDSASTQAARGESRSGLAATGFDVQEDKYEEREFGRPHPSSEMDEIAPGMVNLPPEDDR